MTDLNPHNGVPENLSDKSAVTTVSVRLKVLNNLDSFKRVLTWMKGEPDVEIALLGSPYQLPLWVESWSETIGKSKNVVPFLLAGFHEEEPVLLLPLSLKHTPYGRCVEFLGQENSNQNIGLWRKDFLPKIDGTALRAQLISLLLEAGADFVHLANLPERLGTTPNPLLGGGATPSPSPVYLGDLATDFDVLFRDSHSKAARKKLTKKEKDLRAAGDFQVICAESEPDIARGLEAFLDQRQRRAALTGVPNAFASAPARTFLRKLCLPQPGPDGVRQRPALKVYFLEVAGAIRATYLCAANEGALIGYANSIAHDALTPHSPGVVLLKEIVRGACEDGSYCRLDLGLGDERYKHAWTTPVPLKDMIVGITRRGRLALGVEQKLLQLKTAIRQNPRAWELVRKLRSLKARFF